MPKYYNSYNRKYRSKRRPYNSYYKKRTTRAQRLAFDKKAAPVSAKSVVDAAWKALKIANQVRSVINVENKYKDGEFSDGISSTRDIEILNTLSKGDDHDDREGDKILMQTLRHQGAYILNDAATKTIISTFYVLDKETKGQLPAATTIWDDKTPANYPMFDPRNRDYTDRYVVLKQVTHTLTSSDPIITFDHFIKLGVHTTYLKDSNTGAIDDIADNGLYIITVSSEPTYTPSRRSSYRLTYTDN